MSQSREFWYFDKEEDAREDNLENSIGYLKEVNNEVVMESGDTTSDVMFMKEGNSDE